MKSGEVQPYSHSPNARGIWHGLEEHLRRVAEDARQFAAHFGCGNLAYWAGLWHDLGKAAPAFQDYLKACARGDTKPVRQPGGHSNTGALWAKECNAEVAALIVAGHHNGLPNSADLGDSLCRCAEDDKVRGYLAAARDAGLTLPPKDAPPFPPWFADGTDGEKSRTLEFLIRMLFSCLVDADYLDAERHSNPEMAARRGQGPSLSHLLEVLRREQQRLMARAERSLLNRARREMYEAGLAAADAEPGIFRLAMPTGGGKTRTGLAFSLAHAVCHGLRRVIVALPYTSIIDQTAEDYRRVFGPEAVLEHHSAVREPAAGEPEDARSPGQLAAQNWDAPIVVSTTVQLFDSLFANRPAPCRKLHNITGSVLILDEVQTLPVHLLEPILDALQQLADHYHVSVVLSTATQPALDTTSRYLKGLRGVRDIISESKRHCDTLKRVQYEIPKEAWLWERVAAEMQEFRQCLAIVNARKDAVALFRELDDPEALHLSTLMCGVHRRHVLDEARRRLKNGSRCRLVSTQLVEAGVDIDFPVVFRAVGPLDRIVQAAGRCNREGRLPQPGRVVVFEPSEGGMPRGAYRSGTSEAQQLLAREGLDLHDPGVFIEYFSRLYQDVDTTAAKIQQARTSLAFEKVAGLFHLIDNETCPVFVFHAEAQEVLARIDGKARTIGGLSRPDWRELQPFIVNVYAYELEQYRKQGMSEPYRDYGFDVWKGGYDPYLGLTGVARDPADLIG